MPWQNGLGITLYDFTSLFLISCGNSSILKEYLAAARLKSAKGKNQ
jgi:hypothetical protein